MLRTWVCFNRIARLSGNAVQRTLPVRAQFSTEKKPDLENKVEGRINERRDSVGVS